MYSGKEVLAVIVAAGTGSRMRTNIPKQFLKIGEKTVLEETVSKFEKNGYVDGIFVVVADKYREFGEKLFAGSEKIRKIVCGGKSRQESVYNALKQIEQEAYVLIHDGARPYVSDDIIKRVLAATADFGAAIPAVEISDTVKSLQVAEMQEFVKESIPRNTLRCVQTPQGFLTKLIKEAHENARKAGFEGTDDAMLLEITGHTAAIVEGDVRNIKITRREDMPRDIRIGYGFDVHRLVMNLPLYIGGEKIPYDKGLLGHSDADVLIHAIMDALLGAAGLGDIGQHFPDTDDKYKGIQSIELLKEVKTLLRENGYRAVNIDATVMCENPKLAPFKEKMRLNIADALGIEGCRVNIKATTTEGLGYTGSGEGIAASSVCLLEK